MSICHFPGGVGNINKYEMSDSIKKSKRKTKTKNIKK